MSTLFYIFLNNGNHSILDFNDPMIIAVLIINAISLIGLIIFLSIRSVLRKRTNYLLAHSLAIREVYALNEKYGFEPIQRYSLNHKYDNVEFYNAVSTTDYLTYELAYSFGKKIKKELNNLDNLRNNCAVYNEEVSNIVLGRFDASSSFRGIEEAEEKLFKKYIFKKPNDKDFYIKVDLYRTNIKGKLMERKSSVFYESAIREIMEDVSDKSGKYFNNKTVWDSIVIVERAKVSNRMRFSIFRRDNNRCRICGSRRNLEIDHIIPIAKGGKSTYDNLQTLCHNCNVRKGTSVD